ncbi:hypothetical protein Q7A53_05980 [Halobacillus rhizosphaerae]|uniref:hypothetical protein n=1 Tax=Halobacillus rhizosphaerae TaxID=3064889 RepID=UPI00398A7DEE
MAQTTLTFKRCNGELTLVGENILEKMRNHLPLSTRSKVDIPIIKEAIKNKGKKLSLAQFSFMPLPLIATATQLGGSGVFWDAFLTYIFPWMLDIAKVFCAVKIAQAFYQEKRGGRDEGTGFGALVTYGKWYLVFWLIPWGVELIDQIGNTMFNDLQNKPMTFHS